MTKFGTAFVDIQPDFSSFDRLAGRKLTSSLSGAGERGGMEFGDGFVKTFERRSQGIGAPLDKVVADFNTKLRTKIDPPKIPTPKAPRVPNIPTPKLRDVNFDRAGRIDLKIAGAEGSLKLLKEEIADLTDKPQTAEIQVKIAKAIAALETVEKQRDKLVSERTEIDVSVKTRGIATPDLSEVGRLDLQITGAEAEVAQIKARIAELSQLEPTIEVKAQTAKAVADLDHVEAKVVALSAKRAQVNVDVDGSSVGVFTRLNVAAQNFLSTLGGGGGGGVTGATARVSAGFISFGSVIGPLASLIGVLALAIGVSLVASLAALVSSLALAAAGVGALGAAIGGVLVPAVALAVGTGVRLGKVFEALKASDAAADQASQNALAGSQAQAAAAQQQQSAARGLADANRQLGQATSAAYREMADAAETASDAIRGVANAQLSLDQAKLSTEQAQLELQKFRAELGATGDEFRAAFDKFTDVSVDTSGLRKALADANKASGGGLDQSQELELQQKILDVRAARLREKDATDGVSDAITASTRAQAINNDFKRKGIAASEGYQAALRGVESATLAVAQAQQQEGFSAAQAKGIDLTAKLTAAEQRFLEKLKEVRTELKGAFQPATDAVIGGMTKALGRLPNLVNPLRASFTRLGEAWGNAIDTFSADLVKPRMVNNLRAFTDGAAELAGPITRGLISLLEIFLNIGRAALPSLVFNTTKVADQLGRWRKGTEDSEKLGKSIRKLVGHTKAWLGAFAAVGKTILTFFGVAAPEGKDLAGSIKALADNTTAWLNKSKNQEKVREFLHDAVGFTKQFVEFMGRLVEVVTRFSHLAIRVFDAVVEKLGGAKSATDALVFTLGTLAALKFARGLIAGVRGATTAFGAAKKAATLMHASFVTGNAVTRTATKVQAGLAAVMNGTALAAARQKVAMIGARIATAASAVASKAAAAAQVLLNIALRANPIGLVITALVALGAGLVLAYQKSETFRRIVDGAFAAVKKGAVLAIQAVIGILDKLMSVWSSMLSALGHVPGFGWAKSAADSIDRAREKIRGLAASLNDLPKISTLKVIVDAELSKDMRKLLDRIETAPKITKTPPVPGLKRHYGGVIPGVGNTDSVRAWLTPGEHVTRKLIVKKFGPTVFNDINEGRLDPTVGYDVGERPSVSTRPVRGNHYALGGVVASRAAPPSQTVQQDIDLNITVPGGGPPDPVALGVLAMREVEARGGGFPRQT